MMDLPAVLAGLLAYLVSVAASVVLVFLLYRANSLLTKRIDEQNMLLSGNRSVAVTMGSIILSQAVLLRHAVFPTMVVVRDLFTRPASFQSGAWVLAHTFLFFLIIGVLSFSSVAIAAWLFSRVTRSISEQEEIEKDNLAVALFFAFVVLGITLILNEGLEDLSRSMIPYGETGVINLR